MINLIDKELLAQEPEDPRYINSPFRFLKQLHAKQAGKRYEAITECVLKALGYTVSKATSTDHDRTINNSMVEMKGSCLNKGTNHFSFLQIRPNQEYDEIMFSMFYPDELVIMTLSKEQVLQAIEQGVFKSQHGGKKGNSGTYSYYGTKESLRQLGAKTIE
jgi:hypothetical protein